MAVVRRGPLAGRQVILNPKLTMKTKPATAGLTPHSKSDAKPAWAAAKPKKVATNFSQSRDTREDRGARQMKTTQNSQTFPHVR